jgi:membrane-bound inhibitor of C-type lysozyme
MNQTAVDWMFDQLWETPKDKLAWFKILMEATAMHKEEIKEAYKCGATDLEIQYSDVGEINSEQYYNETYVDK